MSEVSTKMTSCESEWLTLPSISGHGSIPRLGQMAVGHGLCRRPASGMAKWSCRGNAMPLTSSPTRIGSARFPRGFISTTPATTWISRARAGGSVLTAGAATPGISSRRLPETTSTRLTCPVNEARSSNNALRVISTTRRTRDGLPVEQGVESTPAAERGTARRAIARGLANVGKARFY